MSALPGRPQFRPAPRTNTTWQQQARCRTIWPETFFPGKWDRGEAAKHFCQQCTVKTQCLQFAVDNDIREGVWGGLTENERKHLRRKTGAA